MTQTLHRPRPQRAARRRRRTLGVRGYTIVLAVLAFLTAIASGAWFPRAAPGVVTVVMLCGALTAAAWLVLRFRFRDQIIALDLFEAVLAPLIFAAPGPLTVITAVVAQTLANARRGIGATKTAFNAAQWGLAAGVGSIVFGAIREGTLVDIRNLLALFTALVAVTIVNQTAVAGVVHLAQRVRFRRVLVAHASLIAFDWSVNTAFGLVFVMAFATNPAALGLLAVTLFLLHRAYQGRAAAIADKTRLATLYRVTQTLAEPIDPREAIPRFLAAVQECFAAEVVDLVVAQDGGRVVHRIDGRRAGECSVRVETHDVRSLATELGAVGEPVRVTAGHTDLATAALLRKEGWRDCLAAPLVTEGRSLGVLCAYNRGGLEGYDDGELDVLRTIAAEAAAMIRKGTLLQEILDERRKLAEIVNVTSDGIMTIAPDGTILTWNPGFERITGYKASEMVKTRLVLAAELHDTKGRSVSLERWALDVGEMPTELQVRTKDGHDRWLSCTYTRVADADGAPRVLIVLARDVTKARELERMKDDFVATVSHELRTPLTPIKGWATTLLEHGDRLDEQQRKAAIESIVRQTHALERLITNLLEAAQIERGTNVRRNAVVDVAAIVRKTIDDARVAHPGRAIVLDVDGADEVIRAGGDDLWVERIVSNLLSNALKYAPGDDPIEVRITHRDDRVTIDVTDHGPGIPRSQQQHIFERFHRLGDHMTRATGGAGLGLYIARQLAASVGGTVTVRSEPGAGATFTLTLRSADALIALRS